MIKQVIAIRKDLKMGRGKEVAQGAHAAMIFITDRLRPIINVRSLCSSSEGHLEAEFSPQEIEWITGGPFTKICVRVYSEEELLELHQQAKNAGLVSHLVQDSGATVFKGVPTYTCFAVGPDEEEKIDKITGHLKPY